MSPDRNIIDREAEPQQKEIRGPAAPVQPPRDLFNKIVENKSLTLSYSQLIWSPQMLHLDQGGPDDYKDRQSAHDKEYVRAWEDAPLEFKEQAAKAGLIVEPENRDGETLQFNDNHIETSYKPDMAMLLDDYIDTIIEKYGTQHAVFIRAICNDLKLPMEHELLLHRSELLARAVGYLISDEKGNILAKAHALLHSVPRMARCAGYVSIRASARKCKVSPEWLRRARDKCCLLLGILAPPEGTKSAEAKEKYRLNALSDNHWRRKKFHAANNNGEHINE